MFQYLFAGFATRAAEKFRHPHRDSFGLKCWSLKAIELLLDFVFCEKGGGMNTGIPIRRMQSIRESSG